ncbi:MAG: prepilin-type N-terminal cleavage/methylation domain-containing protein [Planctomycetota bacterium]|nr:prepilin-type N-terminal cleavage/methylation domain-containing protein [Planctomycetota bacterium]
MLPRRLRAAFTLLEIVIVLAIVSTIAALAWPVTMRWIADRSVHESAIVVRSSLVSARLWAIDTSLTYQFRFEPNGRNFIVFPHDREYATSNQTQPNADPAYASARAISGELPENVSFQLLSDSVSVEQLTPELLKGLPNAAELSRVRWSAPLLFHSDGTALTDATIRIADKAENEYHITIRSLTGMPTLKEGPPEVAGL